MKEDVLNQLSQAQVYVSLADLAQRDYAQVFNSQSLSISMVAIEAFEKLRERVSECQQIRKPIREDELCLVLMEALNKLRDIIEKHFETDKSIQSQKEILLKLVTKFLNIELLTLRQQFKGSQEQNSDLIYILFLYQTSLDRRKDASTGQDIPNPATLLYSISLKEHEDIKIRKESNRQIDNFEAIVSAFQGQKDQNSAEAKKFVRNAILMPLLEEVQKFFNRSEIHIFQSVQKLDEYMHFTQGTSFQSSHYNPLFIEQCLEVSDFAMKFFKQIYDDDGQNGNDDDNDEEEMIFDVLQRELMFNINMNFTNLKSDFSKPLSMINKFIKIAKANGKGLSIMASIGSAFIYKLQKVSGNLDQQILCLKIMTKLLKNFMNFEQKQQFLGQIDIEKGLLQMSGGDEAGGGSSAPKMSHESQLQQMIRCTLGALLIQDDENKVLTTFKSKIEQIHQAATKSLSPNVKEEIKLLVVCIQVLAQDDRFEKMFADSFKESIFGQATDLILAMLEKNEIVSTFTSQKTGTSQQNASSSTHAFRIHLIRSLTRICSPIGSPELKKSLCYKVANYHMDKDFFDVQTYVGKFLGKMMNSICQLQAYTEDLMKFIKSKESSCKWISIHNVQETDQIDSKSESSQLEFQVTLTSRRNCVIYLNELMKMFCKQEIFIQQKFVELQNIFLKYIFDKKAAIQDISSTALTLIYQIGDSEVKESLVQSLSATLTGDEKSRTVGGESNDDKEEDRELLLDSHDQSSTEQRKKLRTYKDLCKIATDIGHKEMIYQFMEVHRHLTHYRDMSNAAKGLSNIIMMDDRLKNDLLKITPKILMLTYDYNDEVRDTMRQLWSTLIDVKKEQQIIEEKWPEILKEALNSMKQKEFRKRLSACLVLTDLLPNKSWKQLKDNFKELFLGSLALLDDDMDAVKKAARNLVKTNRRLTMKLANIYSNDDLDELKEILAMVIPMTIDQVIKSNIKEVKFYGVNMLFEIVKSSTQERMYQNMKIQNKYERQLAFNYNSEQKMKEILNEYLDRIIIEVISNLSQMNSVVDKINQIELYAQDQGIYSGQNDQSKISEGQINDLRIKHTQDSEWGEILAICRKQMNEATFDKILNDLLNLMIKGHDLVTKSTAVVFVQDIILENKLELIAPKNSRKIGQRLIDVYSQNSVTACLQLKDSLVQLYANCLGLQFKILRAFPQTTQQFVGQLMELPDELEQIKSINCYEIMKNLPAEMLRTGGPNGEQLMKDAVPMFYINRYKTNDQRLRSFSQRVWRYLKDQLTEGVDEDDDNKHDDQYSMNIEMQNSNQILARILLLFDSNSYDERISAGLAMEDLCLKMQPDELGQSEIVAKNIQKMFELISGKYFTNKELLIESFSKIMALMEMQSPWRKDFEFLLQFTQMCIKQIDKFSTSNENYKNKIIGCLNECLASIGPSKEDGGASQLPENELRQIAECCLKQLTASLDLISLSAQSFIETGLSTFEEKKDDEKQRLQTVLNFCDTMACIWQVLPSEEGQSKDEKPSAQTDSHQSQFLTLCQKYYSITNFMVRNAILKTLISIFSSISRAQKHQATASASNAKAPQNLPNNLVSVANRVLKQTAECGEKYDMNLELLSELCLILSQSEVSANHSDELCKHSRVLIDILKAKGGDVLLKNIDVIRANLAL